MATKKKRRMRLPNGLGSVHKIGDGKQRRRPWRARVPSHLEFDPEKGKATQKYITLGYYETEADAIAALFDYRKNPYTLDAATCTFKDVFESWKEKKYPDITLSSQKGYNTAYNHSEPLHNMKMRDIRIGHMDNVIQSVTGGHGVQVAIIKLWNQMFKFSLEHDLVQKNYAEFVKPRDKAPETNKTAIPKTDRKKIWKAIDGGNESAQIMMIYIYTGLRANELLEMKKENVNLSKRMMVGGSKTKAGKNRRIPIHKDILPFISRLMETEGDYLITKEKNNSNYNYRTFEYNVWSPLMKELGMDYTPHYCRHTCATILREANVPEDLRKLILGHATGDITDRYTHISDEMLVEAIDMLPHRA